ncbi:hypothetical protein BGX34_005548 [Mortierella sp. NVP85]|nr:hypothetical protein BGX34_005548 [Mortierella sp. NVP85]
MDTKIFRIKDMALGIKHKHTMVVVTDTKDYQIMVRVSRVRGRHIMAAMDTKDCRIMAKASRIRDKHIMVVMDTKASQTQVISVAMDSSKVCRIKEQLKEAEVKHRSNLKAMDLIKEELINLARKILVRRASRTRDPQGLSRPLHNRLLRRVILVIWVVVSRTVFLVATRQVFLTIHPRTLDKGIHLVNPEPHNNAHTFLRRSGLLLH